MTAGLDSAVLGESEILGQVKVAWERARDEGAAGPALNLLFRHALEVGKRARTETGIARNIASVSQAAVAMAGQRLGGLDGQPRAGARAPARWARAWPSRWPAPASAEVRGRQPHRRDRADDAGRPGRRPGRAAWSTCPTQLGRGRRAAHLHRVAGAAWSSRPTSRRSWPRRAGRPLLIVDIAVPRDVDPAVGRPRRRDPARHGRPAGASPTPAWPSAAARSRRVEAILADELERYLGATSAREVAPMIVALRRAGRGGARGRARPLPGPLDDLDARQLELVEA